VVSCSECIVGHSEKGMSTRPSQRARAGAARRAAWLLARTAPVIALGTAFRGRMCADRRAYRPCARTVRKLARATPSA